MGLMDKFGRFIGEKGIVIWLILITIGIEWMVFRMFKHNPNKKWFTLPAYMISTILVAIPMVFVIIVYFLNK